MTSSSTKSKVYVTLHPFDAVYTIVFIFLMLNVLTKTLVDIFNFGSTTEVSIYNIILSLFFFFQLSRMYYHLKNFESIIVQDGNNHFLEILPDNTQSWEKVVRIMLAAILVLFSKFQDYFGYSSPVTLIICFLFLIIWDFIVVKGLIKKVRESPAEINANAEPVRTSNSFFYWKQDELNKDKSFFSLYIQNYKFGERFFGLLASVTALHCHLNSNSQNGLPIITLGIFVFAIILFTILGKWKTNYLTPENAVKEIIKNVFRPFYMPLLALVNNIKNNNMNNGYNKKLLPLTFVVLIAILVFLFWKNWNNSKKEEVVTTTSIKIATSKNLWCAMTLVAIDRHYFEQEGLKPEVNYQAAGRLNMDALLGGSVDIANVVETNIAYQALNKITDLKIHGRIVLANDYTILTTQASKIFTAQDFRDKSVTYAQATGSESFLFWFMEHNNLLDKNLKLIPLQPAGLVDNFKGGGSDAVTSWEPFVSTIQSQKKDLGSLFRADSLGFKGIMTIATKASWAKNNKSTLDAYNRAMIKAAQFLKDSTNIAQQILSKETGIPIETIINSWSRFNYDYTENLEGEKILITDVIRRIKLMVADKKNIAEENVELYFK